MARARRVLCAALVGVVLAGLGVGCQQSPGEPPATFSKNLGTEPGELLLPYEPAVSKKILQDPAAFRLSTGGGEG